MNIIDDIKQQTSYPANLPAIAVRDVVMFPGMSLPISVDRQKSVMAIELALGTTGKYIIAVSQKAAETEEPTADDIYKFGVLAEITQSLKMPDGSMKVFLQGIARAKINNLEFNPVAKCWYANAEYPSDDTKLRPLCAKLWISLKNTPW